MSLTRRSLFRGAAATGLTVASGGAGKVAQGAAMVAGGAATMAKARGLYEILTQAGKQFPHDGIFEVSRSVLERMKGVDQKTGLQERLLGRGSYARYEINRFGYEDSDFMSDNRIGKIDFSLEKSLYYGLKKLPSDIPIMDLLSDDFYMVAIMSGDVGEKERPNVGATATAQQVKSLRDMLEPLCDEGTTAADLNKTLNNFFVRLGRHALEKPDDFATTGTDRSWGLPGDEDFGIYTEIHNVREMLERMSSDGDGCGGLTDALKQKAESFKREIAPLHKKKVALKQEKQKERRQKKREALREKQKDSARNAQKERSKQALKVNLFRASETEFVVDQASRIIPSRKDWFNWIKSIDQEDAKICDIKTSHGGFAVTVQNQIAIDFLNAVTDEDHPAVLLEFPVCHSDNPEIDQSPT